LPQAIIFGRVALSSNKNWEASMGKPSHTFKMTKSKGKTILSAANSKSDKSKADKKEKTEKIKSFVDKIPISNSKLPSYIKELEDLMKLSSIKPNEKKQDMQSTSQAGEAARELQAIAAMLNDIRKGAEFIEKNRKEILAFEEKTTTALIKTASDFAKSPPFKPTALDVAAFHGASVVALGIFAVRKLFG
jgi:hypothetical protein